MTAEEWLKDVNAFTTREQLYLIEKQIQDEAYNKGQKDLFELISRFFQQLEYEKLKK